MNDKLKKILTMIAVFVALFGVSALLTFYMVGSRLTVEMPELAGRDIKEVRLILSDMAINMKITGEEYDRSVPAGHVISQSIKPGENVVSETSVDLVISKGAEVRLIPSVIGNTLDEARSIFKEKGLDVGKVIYVHSPTVAKHVVMAQKPDPDEWTGEAIKIVASAGPYDVIYYSPYLIGMQKRDALALASDLGLSVVIRELDESSVISRQAPEPGAEVTAGETLALTVGGE